MQPPGAASNAFSLFRILSRMNLMVSIIATTKDPNAIDPRLYLNIRFPDENTGNSGMDCQFTISDYTIDKNIYSWAIN